MTELFDWEHKIVPLDTWPDSCLQYSDVTCTMAFRNLTVTSVINETMNDGSEKNQEAGNDELAK